LLVCLFLLLFSYFLLMFYIMFVISLLQIVIEWLSGCCLTSTQQFFSYTLARTNYFSMELWWGLLCTRPTRLVGFLWYLAHWNNSPRINMSPHSDTSFWFRAHQSLFFLLIVACLAEV
jgi:hypothetical protein